MANRRENEEALIQLQSDDRPTDDSAQDTTSADAVAALAATMNDMMKKFETFQHQMVARLDGQQEAIAEVNNR